MFSFYAADRKEKEKSAADCVMLCVFRQHFLKQISRGQLQAAATSLKVKGVHAMEKKNMIVPIASAMIDKGIAVLRKGISMSEITSRDDIKKVGKL